MYRRLRILFTVLFFMGMGYFLGAQTAGHAARSVRLPWPKDDNAWSYEVVIETETEGTYRRHSQEFTRESFVIVSLPPGRYRYRVIPYNFLGRAELEQSSAWRSFEIPAFVSQGPDEPILLPELAAAADPAESDVPTAASDDSTAQIEPDISIDPPGDRNRRAAHLWTAGVSAGTSFYRPWLIATLHATFAPLPYSFLEAGIDLGLVSGDTDAQYYSLYPFAHYAFFVPFPETAGRQSGGWYIGAGGGYWTGAYSSSGEEIPENKFIVDFITGFNLVNMLDISYTLRTDFKGVNHKMSLGYVYRF
ncbi:MAG: hypothetical protein LBH43_16930 [Treponema sp.]|jgi:hypothetical protein|nr:hypothetical protein [Treponema sp.]